MECIWIKVTKVSESRSVVSDSLRPHGILQARILEWVAFSFSRGSSQPREQTQVSCICRWILYQLSHKGSPRTLKWVPIPSPVDLPGPGIKPGSPALQADSLPTELSGKPSLLSIMVKKTKWQTK